MESKISNISKEELAIIQEAETKIKEITGKDLALIAYDTK